MYFYYYSHGSALAMESMSGDRYSAQFQSNPSEGDLPKSSGRRPSQVQYRPPIALGDLAVFVEQLLRKRQAKRCRWECDEYDDDDCENARMGLTI
jgi:hypothetical protein